MPYYAVNRGRRTGVFETWDECAASVDKYAGARFKKFKNLADARYFVRHGKSKPLQKITTFFRTM